MCDSVCLLYLLTYSGGISGGISGRICAAPRQLARSLHGAGGHTHRRKYVLQNVAAIQLLLRPNKLCCICIEKLLLYYPAFESRLTYLRADRDRASKQLIFPGLPSAEGAGSRPRAPGALRGRRARGIHLYMHAHFT